MIFVMFIYTIDYLLVNNNVSVIPVFTKRRKFDNNKSRAAGVTDLWIDVLIATRKWGDYCFLGKIWLPSCHQWPLVQSMARKGPATNGLTLVRRITFSKHKALICPNPRGQVIYFSIQRANALFRMVVPFSRRMK